MITTLLLLLAQPQAIPLDPGPSPITNPFKGYAPYVEANNRKDIPTTMAFFETSWRELEPTHGNYKFAEWEAQTAKTTPTKRTVIRVYMDYPDKGLGLPQWLIDQGVKMTPYKDFGGGKSPDYSDPRLRKALMSFIKAYGERYDKDPQVAFVQMGILGHWGEWHTWPTVDLFASDAVQKEVVDAMRAAFPHKKIMGRNAVGYLAKQEWVGFHDDMIPQDTVGPDDWQFVPTMKAAGRDQNWKIAPTGGEMVPGAAQQYLGKEWDLTLKAVDVAHLTWIGPYCPTMNNATSPEYKQRAEELSQKMGYDFQLKSVDVSKDAGKLTVTLKGTNQGVAPFYYQWPVRFALIDDSGRVGTTADSNSDIRTWLPGAFTSIATLTRPAAGHYRLAFGLIDPWLKKPGVQFANRLASVDGWTVLTSLTL